MKYTILIQLTFSIFLFPEDSVGKKMNFTSDSSYMLLYNKGRQFEKQTNFDSALFYYHSSANKIDNQIFLLNQLTSHNQSVESLCEKYAECYYRIFWIQIDMGMYVETLHALDTTCEHLRKCMDTTNTFFADFYDQYGTIYRYSGDYETAFFFHQKSLNVFNLGYLNSGSRSAWLANSIASCYNNMGIVLRVKGNYGEAIPYYKLALNFKKKAEELGMQNVNFANTYNNIGNVYLDAGDYDYALIYFRQAHILKSNLLGENHLDVSSTLNNIGIVHWYKREYDEALGYFLNVLKVYTEKLPSNHPYIANIYTNIGLLYYDLKDFTKGIDYTEKSLEIRIKKLGGNHPSVAETYSNLSNFYLMDKNFSLVTYFNQKALEIMINNFGNLNPSVGKVYCSIANIYKQEGKLDSALIMYQNSLCSLVDGYTEKNIYKNPSLWNAANNSFNKNIIDELKLFDALTGKAETFFLKIKD